MRKIVLDLAVTLDGFIEGNNGETDWCLLDEDMDFDGFLATIDTIFYGRVSYDAWGHYLPGNSASEAETKLWKMVHSKKKYVFSRQHRQDDRASFISTDISARVTALKKETGKDIWLYGGASLIKAFIQADLVDIYRLSVHPIALGTGKPLFEDLKNRVKLSLIKTNVFKSGVVQLIYTPESRGKR